ncbi:long-chain-fatty-acid--CoA ligase 5 [Trichonephila clavipes]|nr:long-chain-fatty-acid--CoA ligase 5 [Trichonephila clavipes]
MNTHLLNPVSMKTIQRELHTANIHGRVAIRKPLVSGWNAAKRLQWCRDHLNWTRLQWQQIIWSDESSFTLFQTTGRVFVWRTPTEAFHVDCLVLTVKHGGGSVMIIFTLCFRLVPRERPVFQEDNAPVHTSRCVQTWLHEHDDEAEHLTWCPQSPDLNIIKPLWSYLENKVHARFPPPHTLFELETVLHEEWYFLTVFACAMYSMVTVPLYVSLGFQSIIYIINQANLSLVFVNSEENALKILRNVEQVPSLRSLVMIDPITPQIKELAQKGNVNILQLSELENIGRSNLQELVLPKPDDLFCIPYTSGTTGVPKGALLTHRSLISCVSALVYAYGEAGIYGGSIISYLPPAHIYEIVNQVASMYFARRIAFYSGDIKKLVDEIKIVNPTILPLVPRLMNALYGRVMEKVSGSPLKSFLLRTALKRKEKLLKRGKVSNKTIWDKLVFKQFQEALGDQVHIISTTSAPISAEVMTFFRSAAGCYLFEVYGQTEVLAATMTLPLEYTGGSPGAPLPCNHIKLVDVPEMGYFSKDDFGEVIVHSQLMICLCKSYHCFSWRYLNNHYYRITEKEIQRYYNQ